MGFLGFITHAFHVSVSLAADYDRKFGADLCGLDGHLDLIAFVGMSNYYMIMNGRRHLSYSHAYCFGGRPPSVSDAHALANGATIAQLIEAMSTP